MNPNSKIPALLDRDGPENEEICLFESGSIMLYLAEKHGKFLPARARARQEVLNWLFWQMAGQVMDGLRPAHLARRRAAVVALDRDAPCRARAP